MNCPRCGAWLLETALVVHLEDTADGLYAVVDAATSDYVLGCRCGLDVAVTSTRQVQHHPGQLTLATKGVA